MDKTIEQLKPIFDKVAEKIGQGTEFGWSVMLKQQYVIAFDGLLWFLISLTALFFMNKWRAYILKEHSDEMVWLPFGICLILIVVLGCICLDTFVTHLSNPQFYALQDLIGLVK